MLDFNKIKNTKKDRLIIAINMAKIFCDMNDKYEIIQISDSGIEEVLSKIQNLKNKQ